MYVLEMSTNCDGYPHHMIISCTSYTFTIDCDRIISWGMFLVFWQQWHDASACVNMHKHIITRKWNSGKCFYAPVLTLASVWMPIP